jgi:cell division septation protein DedD
MRKKCAMYAKKQLTIIAVAALLVSVSLFYGVAPSMGMASGAPLTTVPANASHAGTNDQKNLSTVSAGNASPSSVRATQVGASVASSAPTKVVTATTTLTPTTLTITANTTTPATNQPFTLSGTLTANGTPLPGKTINLGRTDPSGHLSVTNTTTATNGTYTFTRSESAQGVYYYRAIFSGDTYGPANASVSLTVGTPTTNVQANASHAGTNDQKNLSTVSAGNASSSSVQASGQLGASVASSTPTKVVTATTTPTTKVVTATTPPATKVVTATTTLTPTTMTITTSNANPATNQSFTLTGTLTANNTPLPGKTINLGRFDPSGTWSPDGTTTTATNGTYTFTLSESTQGNYYYQPVFPGDTTYSLSYTGLYVTVGTLTPTTMTLTTNTTTPATNQPFTLSGTLTANGTPLPGKTINLGRIDPSGTWSPDGTTTTATNGTYTFTLSESTPGNYYYQPVFPGDTTYSLSYTGLYVNVVA